LASWWGGGMGVSVDRRGRKEKGEVFAPERGDNYEFVLVNGRGPGEGEK